jgi:hypothetical protein
MDYYDFSRSFVTFRLDIDKKPPKNLSHKPPTAVNNCRLQIACLCTVTDSKQRASRFVLTESCKSERVGAEGDLWTLPNADMCIVASEDEFMVVKSWARRDMGVMLVPESLGPQPERQVDRVEDVFVAFQIYLHPSSSQVLDKSEDIVEATLQNRSLAARIEYDDGDYHVCIDHPVKTMNVNDVENSFQTDTGPIILPDLTKKRLKNSKCLIEVLDHAYEAFNCSEWAEFIIKVPTSVTDKITVNHYSKTRRIENTSNRIIEIY